MFNRILIVRLSALGDIALALPLLFALRRKMPKAHMGWVVDKPFSPLIRGLPQLDRVHVWKKDERNLRGIWRLAREIRSEHYEVSIDPQCLTRSAILSFLAGIPIRVGFRRAPLGGRELSTLFNNRCLSPPEALQHVSARNLHLGSCLGLHMPRYMPVHLPTNREVEMRIERWWRGKGLSGSTLIFGIGAGYPTKMWQVKEMAALVEEAGDHGYASVILWGPYEKHRIKGWEAELGDRVLWAPETDIPEMVALLRLCHGYAGPDSAALHLAWLLDKPTFSWFGASDPARCAPRGGIHAHIARGPHNWHRKKFSATGLQTLKGAEALPVFKKWLMGVKGVNPDPLRTRGALTI